MSDPTPLEQRIADLQRAMEVGFERLAGQLGGQIALLGQRLDQADVHRVETVQRLDRYDERLDALERTSVTREEMTERSRRTVAVAGVVMTVLSLLVGTGVSIIAIIAR